VAASLPEHDAELPASDKRNDIIDLSVKRAATSDLLSERADEPYANDYGDEADPLNERDDEEYNQIYGDEPLKFDLTKPTCEY
jgi:hypothetical protein